LLDHHSDRHALAICSLHYTRLSQLGFTPLDPSLRDQIAVEGWALLINCAPVPIDPYLRRKAVELSLRLRDVIVPISSCYIC
jgi:hypothetical protein